MFILFNSGKGLGKNQHGDTEVIQIKRREEGMGLGGENTSPAVTFKWSDQFWVDVYNKAASSFKGIEKKKTKSTSSSDSDASSESDFDG